MHDKNIRNHLKNTILGNVRVKKDTNNYKSKFTLNEMENINDGIEKELYVTSCINEQKILKHILHEKHLKHFPSVGPDGYQNYINFS